MNKLLMILLFLFDYISADDMNLLSNFFTYFGVHGIFLSNKRNHLVYEVAVNIDSLHDFDISFLKKSYALIMMKYDFTKIVCCVTGFGWCLQKGFLLNLSLKFNIHFNFAGSFGVRFYIFGYNKYYAIEPIISIYLFNYKKNSILISGSYLIQFYKPQTDIKSQIYDEISNKDDENILNDFAENKENDSENEISRWKCWTNVNNWKQWWNKKNENKD